MSSTHRPRYLRGESLATIAGSFSVDATTARRELRRWVSPSEPSVDAVLGSAEQ